MLATVLVGTKGTRPHLGRQVPNRSYEVIDQTLFSSPNRNPFFPSCVSLAPLVKKWVFSHDESSKIISLFRSLQRFGSLD